MELPEDDRKDVLNTFTSKQIATDVINEMDSDDAADLIGELSHDKKHEVISQIEDEEHAKSIVDLLRYDENTAGGLMAKELVKINKDWSVMMSVREMRKQAEEMDEVYSIYVVDNSDHLLGTLSLKKLLTTSTRAKVEDVYNPKVRKVKVTDDVEEVARYIKKYDLYEVPVVDEINRLVGRITVDDILDVITEEAEKDYQMASGISQDIDVQDKILDLTKARLPWLLIGMILEVVASIVLKGNEHSFTYYPTLIIFVPLLSATAGNIGVQSSAIVVQGLANGSLKGFNYAYFFKELAVAMLSGLIISSCLLLYHYLMYGQIFVGIAISISIMIVILFAAILGTLVPLFLNKIKIDPAIATGPFITTTNDVVGIALYFFIAKIILGM